MAITFAFLQIDGICFVCVTYQCCHTKRSFHLIKPGDINRSVQSLARTIVPGMRQLHSVRKVETNVIATRKLSCFCPPCQTSGVCVSTFSWNRVVVCGCQGGECVPGM